MFPARLFKTFPLPQPERSLGGESTMSEDLTDGTHESKIFHVADDVEYQRFKHIHEAVEESLSAIVKIKGIWKNVFEEPAEAEGLGLMVSPTVCVTTALLAGARPMDQSHPLHHFKLECLFINDEPAQIIYLGSESPPQENLALLRAASQVTEDYFSLPKNCSFYPSMRIFTIQLRDVNIHEAGFTLSSHVISGLIDGICHFTHSYDVRTGSVILDSSARMVGMCCFVDQDDGFDNPPLGAFITVEKILQVTKQIGIDGEVSLVE